ncbi:Uncharacterised protein [uncultured archaeon]|nr:Uncharacterised protein [uncultured archaeon]
MNPFLPNFHLYTISFRGKLAPEKKYRDYYAGRTPKSVSIFSDFNPRSLTEPYENSRG